MKYTQQRLYIDDLEHLRKIERAEKRKASIPQTVGYLVKFYSLSKKMFPPEHQIIKESI